jgi:hypothetical protein
MDNSSKILVEIPTEKGVHVKSAGAKGEKYVCETSRSPLARLTLKAAR